jgi:hypothetical protein
METVGSCIFVWLQAENFGPLSVSLASVRSSPLREHGCIRMQMHLGRDGNFIPAVGAVAGTMTGFTMEGGLGRMVHSTNINDPTRCFSELHNVPLGIRMTLE